MSLKRKIRPMKRFAAQINAYKSKLQINLAWRLATAKKRAFNICVNSVNTHFRLTTRLAIRGALIPFTRAFWRQRRRLHMTTPSHTAHMRRVSMGAVASVCRKLVFTVGLC